MDPAQLQARLAAWTAAHPGVFQVTATADGATLLELATAKSLHLGAESVSAVVAQTNAQTGADYLVVERSGRPPLALADPGFAFALDNRHVGEIVGAPSTASFGDFRRLCGHLRHLVDAPEHRTEALEVLRFLIAALDGARAVGLATAVEEDALEVLLHRLEAGG